MYRPFNLMAIDPSINALGWATFVPAGDYSLSGTWTPQHQTHPDTRVSQLTEWLEYMISGHGIGEIVMETPGKRFALRGLPLMVFGQALGCVETVAVTHRIQFHRLDVATWKGSAKKFHNLEDFKRAAKREPSSSHECDAFGLGTHFIQRRLQSGYKPIPFNTTY